mgnify:CR=1 FL=1
MRLRDAATEEHCHSRTKTHDRSAPNEFTFAFDLQSSAPSFKRAVSVVPCPESVLSRRILRTSRDTKACNTVAYTHRRLMSVIQTNQRMAG